MKKLEHTLSYEGYNNHKTMRDELDPRYAATTYVTDRSSVLHNMWSKYFWDQMGDELASSDDSALVHASMTRFGKVLFSAYGKLTYLAASSNVYHYKATFPICHKLNISGYVHLQTGYKKPDLMNQTRLMISNSF